MIHVHGYLGEISPATRSLAGRVALVVGGRRHLDALGVPDERRVVLGALSPAVERLKALPDGDDALVLASGDPGFHGIVRRLRDEGLDLAVTPAVSSVAAAFAAVALPWDDAVVVSAHGRPIDDAVAAARRHPKVAVLTGPGAGVRELAAGLAGLAGDSSSPSGSASRTSGCGSSPRRRPPSRRWRSRTWCLSSGLQTKSQRRTA